MAKEEIKSDKKPTAKAADKVVTIDASIGIELSTDELKATIAAKDAVIAEKDAVIAELLESNATIATAPAETVEVDGVKYIPVMKKFIHGGKTYTADDVLKNQHIAAVLVKSKSPALKKA